MEAGPDSDHHRDFVAVQGIVILIAIIVAVVNFIVDVIAALVDPRVRY